MAAALGKVIYEYTYGAGMAPNRKIEFQRKDESDPKTIYAKIYAISSGKEIEICQVPGHKITIEMMSTSEKMKTLMEQRSGQPYQNKPNKKLSELQAQQQVDALMTLGPLGTRRISISNEIGKNPFYEGVQSLIIFDVA